MSRESIRGFATGLFFATVLLGGYYFLEENNKQTLTVKQLEVESKRLGYTLVKAGDEKESLVEVEKANDAADSLPDSQSSSKPSELAATEAITYTLTITSGMGSDDIAHILFENNIVDNADSFEKYLLENNIARKIRIGEFQVTNEMSFEQIAHIIVKKTQ